MIGTRRHPPARFFYAEEPRLLSSAAKRCLLFRGVREPLFFRAAKRRALVPRRETAGSASRGESARSPSHRERAHPPSRRETANSASRRRPGGWLSSRGVRGRQRPVRVRASRRHVAFRRWRGHAAPRVSLRRVALRASPADLELVPEIVRDRRLDRDARALGKNEPQPPGVQHLPRRRLRNLSPGPAVDAVSDDRIPGRGEVNPDLVGPPRLGPDGDQRRAAKAFEHLEPRHRSRRPSSPSRATVRRSSRVLTRSASKVPESGGKSARQGDVLAFDVVAAEAVLQRVQRAAVAGEDDRSGGVLVEPVHDAGVRPPAVAQLEVLEDAAPESVPFALLGRYGQQAGGLVDDDHVAVLVQHRQSRAHGPPRGPVADELDARPLGDVGARQLDRLAVHVHPAAADRLARRAPRESESARDLVVEPHRAPAATDGARGTRISTKNPGSPIRAAALAPGPKIAARSKRDRAAASSFVR